MLFNLNLISSEDITWPWIEWLRCLSKLWLKYGWIFTDHLMNKCFCTLVTYFIWFYLSIVIVNLFVWLTCLKVTLLILESKFFLNKASVHGVVCRIMALTLMTMSIPSNHSIADVAVNSAGTWNDQIVSIKLTLTGNGHKCFQHNSCITQVSALFIVC